MKVEDLGEKLYVKASWKDPWLNIVSKDEYPPGAGLNRSAFTIGRSEPTTDEETWAPIATTDDSGNYQGSCGTSYDATYVGHRETVYKPEEKGLVGPLVCQDDLTLYWNSREFWNKYFIQLEKRSMKTIVNRIANVYMQYVPKAAASQNFEYVAGDFTTQSPPSSVNLIGIGIPQCALTQQMLDYTAQVLNEEGANDPDSDGWITMGEHGPVYPILIGQEASNDIALNNSEFRNDLRAAFNAFGDANPILARRGDALIIKNFRHMITLFPPRWKLVNGQLSRVPTWIESTASTDATKGKVAVINPDWRNPNIAAWEGAIVLSPWVMHEEVLRPMNAAPGMKWSPLNYTGEWQFVTGNDAVVGFDGCTGISDPLHTRGRHFARYRHAFKPIFPEYGRLIVFKRCPSTVTCVSCS
jgi:hypothetical protein